MRKLLPMRADFNRSTCKPGKMSLNLGSPMSKTWPTRWALHVKYRVSVAFVGEYLLWWECNSEEIWRQCAADAWAVIPVPGRDMKTIMTTAWNHFHINMIYGNSRHKHFWYLINLRKHRYVFDVLSFPMIGKMTGWNVASSKTNIRHHGCSCKPSGALWLKLPIHSDHSTVPPLKFWKAEVI